MNVSALEEYVDFSIFSSLHNQYKFIETSQVHLIVNESSPPIQSVWRTFKPIEVMIFGSPETIEKPNVLNTDFKLED